MSDQSSPPRLDRQTFAVFGILFLVAAALVALTLQREPPPSYPLSVLEPREVGEALVGPVRVTIEAADPERWTFFDLATGAPPGEPAAANWDLAFRRFNVMVNGGAAFAGRGAAVDLGEVPFNDVTTVPDAGWVVVPAGRDSVNPALARWYDYSFTSHLLSPKRRVYALRTADGRYAKLRFLSYYCPGARPGCVTFEYVYQGDGSRRLSASAPSS